VNRCPLALLVVSALGTAAPGAEKPPNVVFLLAADVRADTMAALGNPVAKTPNLDAFVCRGFPPAPDALVAKARRPATAAEGGSPGRRPGSPVHFTLREFSRRCWRGSRRTACGRRTRRS
jgi:hypothetical protein